MTRTQALVAYVREHPGCSEVEAIQAVWQPAAWHVALQAPAHGTITRAIKAGLLRRERRKMSWGGIYYRLYVVDGSRDAAE